MTYGIAIWNFAWAPQQLPAWIADFAEQGFEAISFHPQQFAGEAGRHLPEIVKSLRERKLAAALHGACAMEPAFLGGLIEGLGSTLLTVTLDSVMREDSRGRLHDAGRIAAMLGYLQRATDGTDVRLAIEDFPLDARALAFFGPELTGVYDHPRTGILVDVGHMHLKRTQESAFRDLSVADYLRALPCPLVEVHLHDNNGSKDQHAPFGFGTVPFPELARALCDLRFTGLHTLEIAPSLYGGEPRDARAQAIENLARWRALINAAAVCASGVTSDRCVPS